MGDFSHAIKRAFRHSGAKAAMAEQEWEDPAVQLHQVADAAEQQHRNVLNSAASVMVHEKMLHTKLDTLLKEHDRINTCVQQALLQADTAQKNGDAAVATAKNDAARSFMIQLKSTEAQIQSTQEALQSATDASAQAKAAVETSGQQVQTTIARIAKDQADLDSAKMHEGLGAALNSMNSVLHDDDRPSMDEVETKIQTRLARSTVVAEIGGMGPSAEMASVEHDALMASADVELDAMRAQLGIGTTPAITTGAAPAAMAALSAGQ